jgi:hypothetical protein
MEPESIVERWKGYFEKLINGMMPDHPVLYTEYERAEPHEDVKSRKCKNLNIWSEKLESTGYQRYSSRTYIIRRRGAVRKNLQIVSVNISSRTNIG